MRQLRQRSAPTRLRTSLLAVLGAGSLLLGTSCSTTPDPIWVEGRYEVPSERILWEYVLLTLEKAGYPLGAGIDPLEREIQTGWLTDLEPFKDKGTRRRATVRVAAHEEGGYLIEARVEFERNASLLRQMDLRYAEWKEQPDDEEGAKLLLHHIRAYVGVPLELKRE